MASNRIDKVIRAGCFDRHGVMMDALNAPERINATAASTVPDSAVKEQVLEEEFHWPELPGKNPESNKVLPTLQLMMLQSTSS